VDEKEPVPMTERQKKAQRMADLGSGAMAEEKQRVAHAVAKSARLKAARLAIEKESAAAEEAAPKKRKPAAKAPAKAKLAKPA
jgi:hypothetical protein